MSHRRFAAIVALTFSASFANAQVYESQKAGRLSGNLGNHPCSKRWETRAHDCMDALMQNRPKSTEFQRLIDRARIAADMMDFGVAKRELDAALRIGTPTVADLHFSSRLHISILPPQAEHLNRAAQDIDKALLLNPGDADLWMTKSEVALFQAQPSYRLLALDKAISLDPNHTQALWARSLILLETGRATDAEVDMNLLLSISPKHPWAYAKRAVLYQGQGKLEKAEADADQAIGLRRTFENIWLRATLREERGNVEGAIADLTSIVDEATANKLIVHPKVVSRTLVKRALLRHLVGSKDEAGVDLINALRFLDKTGILRVQAYLSGWGADVPIDATVSAALGPAVMACTEGDDCIEDLAQAILVDQSKF